MNTTKQLTVKIPTDSDGRIPFYRYEGRECEWNGLLRALGAEPLTPDCLYPVLASLFAEAVTTDEDGLQRRFLLCPHHARADLQAALGEVLNDGS